VGTFDHLEEVILVPRNGLGNRLQAWSSAAILAAQLDVPLKVMWEPEAAAPAPAGDLFDLGRIEQTFVNREYLDAVLQVAHESTPRYLWEDADRRIVVLAGHDRGEQVFMADLLSLLAQSQNSRRLIIIAGGLFHMPPDVNFSRQREIFYRNLHWSSVVEEAVQVNRGEHHRYVALHIRQTDRSREAPSRRSIRAGLRALLTSTGVHDLYVAADTAEGRESWTVEAADLGFTPWTAEIIDFDRSRVSGAVSAALDWVLLSRAQAIVYPRASTFSAEAAVATGHEQECVALEASSVLRASRVMKQQITSAVTYPTRHWGKSGP